MRPHVELIDERDLLWHPAEFPHGSGEARQRNLSYDEENGAASVLVEFTTDWQRGPGLHDAQTEWFVLEGEISIGDKTMGKSGYWCTPRGVPAPATTAKAGTRVLVFREYSNWDFKPADASAVDMEKVVIMDSEAMDWYDVIDPENGSPMDFERGGTPVPGLYIKLQWRDPENGFYTRHTTPSTKKRIASMVTSITTSAR